MATASKNDPLKGKWGRALESGGAGCRLRGAQIKVQQNYEFTVDRPARYPSGINLPVGENGQHLSGGQRQLVSLARTLLAAPDLLLMDEPTSAMDAQSETQFIQHLHRATKGGSLVIVTHRPSILALVERIVIIDNGAVVADGPKAEVLARLSANSAQNEGPSTEAEEQAA